MFAEYKILFRGKDLFKLKIYKEDVRNMDKVIKYIVDKYNNGDIDREFTKSILGLIKDEKKKDEIAIIGMSIRIADVDEKSAFWKIIMDGRDCIKEFPPEREEQIKKIAKYRYGKEMPFYKAAFIDDISSFDDKIFKCTPNEASLMDPNHKVFLQAAYRALDDSGYLNDSIVKSSTGIFLGYSPSIKDNYQSIINDVNKSDVSVSIPYNLCSIAASRLSYLLDLRGPAVVVDSACSSGLSAFDIAIKNLRNNDCNLAIVGGVKLHILPFDDKDYMMGIESKDGHTRAFDGSSTGSGVGEGAVAFVLKRLEEAEKDHDNIYAVIKGIAMNQDGASLGITAPNPESQKSVIENAWKKTGVSPETIEYLETHGTGTSLGDPIEVNSINRAFQDYTDKKIFCAIGSVKSNFGHLFECGAMVSVFKSVLTLNNKILPKTVNYESINKEIDFVKSAVYINTINRIWKESNHPRRCGISAFGYSGTNAHMILEEYNNILPKTSEAKAYFIMFSAETKTSLENLLFKYEKYFAVFSEYDLKNISWTLALKKKHYSHRVIFLANSVDEILEKIKLINRNGLENNNDIFYAFHKIIKTERKNIIDGEITIKEFEQLNREAEKLFDSDLNGNALKIINLYCRGANINWSKAFDKDENAYTVSLLSYCFDKCKTWIDMSNFNPESPKRLTTQYDHDIDNNVNEKVKLVIKGKIDLTEIESEICYILQDIFKFREIDVYDNFFELGLDSITMVKIFSVLKEKYNFSIDYKEILNGMNVVTLSERIESSINSNKKQDIKAEVINNEEKGAFQLTNIQKAYVLGRNGYYDLGNTSTHMYLEYETTLDISRLEKALNVLIQKHEMLRAVINKDLTQKILDNVPYYSISIIDMSNKTLLDAYNEQICIRNEMSHYIFDTEKWPLFEVKALVTENKTLLFIGIDLLIADGISLQIICRDLMDIYNNESVGNNIGYSFKEYMCRYSAIKESEEYKESKSYWREKLSNSMVAPSLPLKVKIEDIEKPFFSRYQKSFGNGSIQRFRKIAKEHGVTISAILCTAYAETLRRWSEQKNFIINIASYNRYAFDDRVNDIVGDFTAVLLLKVDYDNTLTFWEKVEYIKNNIFEGLQHRYCDGIEVVSEYLAETKAYSKALFPVVFTSVIAEENSDYMGFWGKEVFGSNQTPQVFLDNQARAYNDEFVIVWDYINEILDAEMVGEMFEYHNDILNKVMNDSAIIQSKNYINNVITDYNNTYIYYKIEHFVNTFRNSAKKYADKVAVILEDTSITYRELDIKSNKLALYLREQNVTNNMYVAIITERKIETIINILAVIKAGAAYVPIDIMYPEERKNYIISNNNCTVVLSADTYEQLDIDSYDEFLCDIDYSIKDIMYTIYTSGSTGLPKGVIETQESVINTIIDIITKFKITDQDKIIGVSSFCFDLSVFDIFASFIVGATLVMVKDQRNINALINTVDKNKVTVWNSVPAIMNLVVSNSRVKLDSLRIVMLSGDWIPLHLPDAIHNVSSDAKVISLGGATEGAIWSIYYDINKCDPKWISIPYGYPLANQTIYILDENLEQCPLGVVGEICIGGMGVAKGYCNDEVKTKAAFLEHCDLGYIYKTGDYGVMRKEGYVEFLGRRDSQVKINGFRVELGEIEKRLMAISEVDEAHVILKDNKICAFVTVIKEISNQSILDNVSKYLPYYMIPNSINIIDKFELTSNGKINYSLLRHLEVAEIENKDETIIVDTGLITEFEMKVLNIIKDLTNKGNISLNSRIYEIGMDSIMIISIITRLNAEFDVDISIEQFFKVKTIKEICMLVENSTNKKADVITQAEEKELYESSEIQKNLYLFSTSKLPNRGYNLLSAILMTGNVDIENCKKTAKKLCECHEALRTTFVEMHGDVYQKINDGSGFELKVVDARSFNKSVDELIENNVNYYSLNGGSLFNMTLIQNLSSQEKYGIIEER